jgi:hypothetical protein
VARLARFPDLSHNDAVSALKWLVATKRIKVQEIHAALVKRDELVAERFLTSVAALRRPAKRRRRKVSAKARAAWKAQGQYLGAVRRLSKADRAKVRAVRQAKGIRAAIAAAKKLAKGVGN